MIYYTADLHLGHENAIKFDQRPFACVEEMDEALIRNWNARVTDRDRIYIAGDLIFRSKRAPEWYLERLRGIKYLVIGNHERLSALDIHYRLGSFAGMQGFLGNVCPYQTDCSRTAGHGISEKPGALFRGWPWFWMWVVASCNSW